MKYCTNCGSALSEEQTVCESCGTPVDSKPVSTGELEDKGGFLWGLLGCCIPIAGLILYLVWKDTKPKNAKALGIGALVCVALCVGYYILMAVLGVAFGMLTSLF